MSKPLVSKKLPKKGEQTRLAWHWIGADGQMTHDGGKVETGKTYSIRERNKKIYSCSSKALHGFPSLEKAKNWDNFITTSHHDYMGYGLWLCRVKMWGQIQEEDRYNDDHKYAARHRHVLHMLWVPQAASLNDIKDIVRRAGIK